MRFYLLNDCGMDTGESFRSIEEVHQWAYDLLGEWPSHAMKRAMRNGEDFQIGSRQYRLEKRRSESMTAAA